MSVESEQGARHMDEFGFEEGQLDDILFMQCRRKQSVNRQKLKLQIAVADLHRRLIEEAKRDNPRFVEIPDVDVPMLTPGTMYIVEKEKAWNEMLDRKVGEIQKELYGKVRQSYREAMERNDTVELDERTLREVMRHG